MLNSGEVPNLFEADEYERIIIGCRPGAKEAGIAEGNRDGEWRGLRRGCCVNGLGRVG